MEFKSYEHKSAGKLLGMTKIRHLWKLKYQGTYYEIKVAESLISGKFVVMVQNDIVFNEKVDSSAKKRGISVSAEGMDLMFKNASKGLDLFVNMIKFQPNSSGGASARDDDFGGYESNVKKGGNKDKWNDDSSKKNNDHMEGSWAAFDAMDDSDEEGGFDNFGTKGGKPTKPGNDPFGKPAYETKDAFANFGAGPAPGQKVNIQAKPTDQKTMGLKFKSNAAPAKNNPFGGNKDPFGGKNDDDDGWGASSSKPSQQGGWAPVGGNDNDDDDGDEFLNFGAQAAPPQKPNLLPNFPSKNPVSNQQRQGSGFGFDAPQSSTNDPFAINQGGNRPQQQNKAPGFDAFGAPAAKQPFGQPAQQKQADPFGGWGQAPAQPQNAGFGAFNTNQAPAQPRPQQPAQGNNMWSNFSAKPQGQANPFGQAPAQPQQQQQQNPFGNQAWGAQPQKPPQQAPATQPAQQRPPQTTGANMWANFQPNQGFNAPQQRPAQPAQPAQQRPPQPPAQNQWAQQAQPNPFGQAPPQQQQNPWGQAPQQGQWGQAPQQQQNPFGGAPPQQPQQQRPPAPPQQQAPPQQPPQQLPQQQVSPQQQAPPQQPKPDQAAPQDQSQQQHDNTFGGNAAGWDMGFAQQNTQGQTIQHNPEAQPTIEQNPFTGSGQDQGFGQGDQMYPKPDLSQFGGAHFDHQAEPAQTTPIETPHFDLGPPLQGDNQTPFGDAQHGGDPFAVHANPPAGGDPFAVHADANLNEQMGALNFNAPADSQPQGQQN